MTGSRSALFVLKSDRRPIRLADEMVIFFGGIGSIRFLSSCGYRTIVHDVFFVPLLATSLFSANKFAMEHKSTHFEVLEYPERRWINRHMNFVEFMATIRIPRYSRPLVAHLLLIYFGFSTSVLNGSYHSLCHSGVWVSGEGEPMAGDVHRPREERPSKV